MGCTQGRPLSMTSPSPSLHRLKMANGYVTGETLADQSVGVGSGRVFRQESKINGGEKDSNGSSDMISSTGCEENKFRSETDSNGSQEMSTIVTQDLDSCGNAIKTVDDHKVVDGWPKWLTDNVPRDALDGLTPRSAETYDKIDKVGQGTYSNVYKARDKYTGKVVAMKKVRFDTSEPESIKFMAREIRILRKLDHPNVVKLQGLATSRMHYSIYLVFDYMQCDLSSIISRPDDRLTEPQVKSYMHQLLLGMHHCHERGILHRDIKGSNMLIDRQGMLKIADFGLANYYHPEKRRPLTSRVVTLWYRAPELLLGATEYDTGIDLWSVGCLMAEMFTGKPIMPGRTEVEQLHKIFKLCGTPSEDFWKRVKLPTTFRPPQTYKPKIKDVFKNLPSSCFGLLSTLLALDPAKRGSAASALQELFFSTMPLACDLSGLPVLKNLAEDEPIQPMDIRRIRSAKMRHKSQSLAHTKKEYAAEKPDVVSEALAGQEIIILRQGAESSATSTSSSVKQTIGRSSSKTIEIDENASSPPLASPYEKPSKIKMVSRTQVNNFPKNRPPLPEARRSHHSNPGKKNNMYHQPNEVPRSVSTREFRNLDRNKLLELHAVQYSMSRK